jgi:competence protein ComGC
MEPPTPAKKKTSAFTWAMIVLLVVVIVVSVLYLGPGRIVP